MLAARARWPIGDVSVLWIALQGCALSDDYFDERMVDRQRLLWAVATRRQLERWEPLVAAAVLASNTPPIDGAHVWSMAIEHHLTLVAGRNLLWALDLPPSTTVPIDPNLRADLKEGRDLHEHWTTFRCST